MAALIIYFLVYVKLEGSLETLLGAVNSLFSALGLAVLIYTVYLQHEEFKQKRL